MIDLSYPKMLDLFGEYLAPKIRSESASFLIWYLENYYRLDSIEAVDCVCDQSNDKGVDGIFVNDNDQTITVFQSRISQTETSSVGDKPLREFAGTLTQFKDASTIQKLIASAKNTQLATLCARLDLVNKIATHDLRAEYVTNIELDGNGVSFLMTQGNIAVVGKSRLLTTYISDEREEFQGQPIAFDIAGIPISKYVVDANVRALIAPIKATQLVTLEGIADQSLFARNVRGPLGHTNVNRDIVDTLKNPTFHKMFPVFHNGITMLAAKAEDTDDTITVSKYFVVNGCQSLTSLFNNQKHLTADLRVLVKIVEMNPESEWAETITRFSNNQNGVKARDFRSNNSIQIRLQNEFAGDYAGQYFFEVKRGEHSTGGVVIRNQDAGLYLMAFDLKRPWATHRKYEVFEDRYADIFGRPEVKADRVVLLDRIMDSILKALPQIENEAFAKYKLTQYMLLFFVREVLEDDAFGTTVLTGPEAFVRKPKNRQRFGNCIDRILGDIVVDLNLEVKELGQNFDYRDKLREEDQVKKWAASILGTRKKLLQRGSIKSFKQEWEVEITA